MLRPTASEFFITGLCGTSLTKGEESFIRNNRLGGVILFKHNIASLEQVIDLNSSIIRANIDHPPLITIDQEGGRVARLRGICTDIPPMAHLESAFTANEDLAFKIGAMQGRELVALGFNLNFSPVCDVLSEEGNQVIGDRAFSKSADQVARFSAKYIKGLQGAGVAACAKHFPGHGATAIDSHLALPTVDTDMATLALRELLPFKSAIAAGVESIMTAHIIARALDSRPATISQKALALLRNSLGFKKVLISDDLDMKAIADNFSLPEVIRLGMLASIDMFIISDALENTVKAMTILQGLIDTERPIASKAIDSWARIRRLRERFIGTPAIPELAYAQKIIKSAPHLDLIHSF